MLLEKEHFIRDVQFDVNMAKFKLVNMVGISKVGDNLDLNNIVMNLKDTEYEPEAFPGLVFKIKEPKAAFLIFRSGKVVCTGTRSTKDAQAALDFATSKLKDVGVNVLPNPQIEIVNMVASVDMESRNLNLNQVAMALGLENIEYEPEQFPGLVYRMRSPKVVLLIFSTGKVICAGARSKKDVELAVENLERELTDLGFL